MAPQQDDGGDPQNVEKLDGEFRYGQPVETEVAESKVDNALMKNATAVVEKTVTFRAPPAQEFGGRTWTESAPMGSTL
ncbi:MAG: hypothetical protein HY337_08810 [Gemmatimonadetes bacterium]|nr:hypothetical protein [Gemmatimonadota bacterium]